MKYEYKIYKSQLHIYFYILKLLYGIFKLIILN